MKITNSYTIYWGEKMNKIRYCREQKKMSQKYVAISVGVSAPMVSQWESGIKQPSKENLVKLANLFGVSTDFLLDHTIETNETTFTPDERQLILIYRQLNQTGRDLLISSAHSILAQEALRQDGSASSAK